MPRFAPLRFRAATLDFGRVRVVGVLNLTPDSFSDGGRFSKLEDAVLAGIELCADGAEVLDIGGESTRPGARPVSAAEEQARVVPVIAALAQRVSVPLSVDTTKASVADAALRAGAEVVNDISGGRFDPDIVGVAHGRGAAYVLGHVAAHSLEAVHAAAPPTFEEVARELAGRAAALPDGLWHRTVIDPGLGFGKGTQENLELLRRAGELAERIGRPVMVGPSRKRFLGEITGRGVAERDDATVGACLAAAAAGAHLVRVHDVKRVRDALSVWQRVFSGPRTARHT